MCEYYTKCLAKMQYTDTYKITKQRKHSFDLSGHAQVEVKRKQDRVNIAETNWIRPDSPPETSL